MTSSKTGLHEPLLNEWVNGQMLVDISISPGLKPFIQMCDLFNLQYKQHAIHVSDHVT